MTLMGCTRCLNDRELQRKGGRRNGRGVRERFGLSIRRAIVLSFRVANEDAVHAMIKSMPPKSDIWYKTIGQRQMALPASRVEKVTWMLTRGAIGGAGNTFAGVVAESGDRRRRILDCGQRAHGVG